MPVTEILAGESTPQANSQPQLVDAAALASELTKGFDGVFARLDAQGQAAAPAAQARISQFKREADALLSNDKVDQDVVSTMLKLLEAAKADISVETREAVMKEAFNKQLRDTHAEVGRLIDRYAGDDKTVKKMKPVLADDVITEYNTHAVAKRFTVDGFVDWNLMDTLAVKHTKQWATQGAEPADKKPAGGIAMKNEAPANSGASTRSDLSLDSLNTESQREFVKDQIHFGVKNMGMDRAKAEERALRLLNSAEAKNKSWSRR